MISLRRGVLVLPLLLGMVFAMSGIGHTIVTAEEWPISSGGNGHYYNVVYSSASWSTAESAARSLSFAGATGHLATVTSQGEKNFLVESVLQGFGTGYIGGFQPAPFEAPGVDPDPAAGWQWVTGEPFVYTNWSGGEPNDAAGGENALEMYYDGVWNDRSSASDLGYYIVEYDFLTACANDASNNYGAARILGIGNRSGCASYERTFQWPVRTGGSDPTYACESRPSGALRIPVPNRPGKCADYETPHTWDTYPSSLQSSIYMCANRNQSGRVRFPKPNQSGRCASYETQFRIVED